MTIKNGLLSLFLLMAIVFGGKTAFAVGAPDYKPDGSHPRIWLTPSVISAMKAKKTANTADWQALITNLDTYIWPWATAQMPSTQNFYGLYSWPQGDGYVGSGFYDVITGLGVAYHTLKTPAYAGAASVGADDLKAYDYASKAFALMAQLIPKYSGGEEYDGIEFIRISDDKSSAPVTINADEAAATHPNGFAYTTNGSMSFKSGYSARSTAQTIPLFYDWFYNDPLMTSTTVGGFPIKDLLWKMMYRHIDWYNATRSPYNNGVKIGSTYYHEDSFHKDWYGNTVTYSCNPPDNCNLSATAAASPYKQYGYGNPNSSGRVGSNFYEPFVGLVMLNAVAAYGDAPTAHADYYLNYAKTLWEQHKTALSSSTGWKGGDSLEGLAYNSCWQSLFQGILALNTGAGIDTWTGFGFPKEFAKNYIHNTDPTLTVQIQRGALNKPQNTSYWHHPSEFSLNTFSHILRNFYPTSDEAKQLQYFLSNAALIPISYNSSAFWQRLLFRDNTFTTKDFSTEPLYYRSEGSGVVTTRSSWSKTATDSVMAQVVLGGVFNVDHQAQDQGAIVLNRGTDRLLSRFMDSSNNSDETSQGQNSIVFGDGLSDGGGLISVQSNDSGMTSGTTRSPTPATPLIDRLENADTYLYVSADVANVFSGAGNTNLALGFRRSVVHLRPNILVVYDVTRSNSAKSNKKSWYMQFEAAPTIDSVNRNISATVGSSKVFVKGLFPATGTYTDTPMTNNVNMSSTFHRVKYEPPVLQEYDQFLHVVEATASTASQAPTEKITSTEGKMVGAYIKDATNPNVVMFSVAQNGNDITGNVTYSISAPTGGVSPWHTIVHMPVNTYYTVVRPINSNVAQTYQLLMENDSAKGAVIRTSSQGVLRIPPDIAIQPPAPTTSASAGSGGGCFIATAAYGSYLHPQVQALRNFRDTYLLTNRPGRAFVALYYHFSPPIADFIAQHETFRLMVRLLLTPIVLAVVNPELSILIILLIPVCWAIRRRWNMKEPVLGISAG